MSNEKNYPVVDGAESFEALLERVRAAQRVFAGYTQERTSAKEEYTPDFDLRGI